MRPSAGPQFVLEAADAYSGLLAKRHYENFSVAAHFVEPAIRRDLCRIYAFCRTTDDLGDESRPGAALARLERWREEVQALFAGAQPIHPVLIALEPTIRERGMSPQPFLDLIEANVRDQRVTRYQTWAELDEYCRLSAAPVGRMVLAVFGLAGSVTEPLSDDVCIGLQLANHAQDVSRDARLGRTYLIQSDIAEAGVAGAVERMVARARRLLASGRALEPYAPGALRLQLALYRLGGLAICDAIERIGYNTMEKRPSVAAATKVSLVVRAALEAFGAGRTGQASLGTQ
jgi:squalene synthase HpnC